MAMLDLFIPHHRSTSTLQTISIHRIHGCSTVTTKSKMPLERVEHRSNSMRYPGTPSKSSQAGPTGDDYDEEEPYSAHDDDITLLPTRRSKSHSPSKSSTSSLRSSRSRISRASSSRANTWTRFNEYVLDVMDADDILPDEDELAHISPSKGERIPEKSRTFFHLREGRTFLRVEVFGKLTSMLRSCGVAQAKLAQSSRSNGLSSSDDSTRSTDLEDLTALLKLLHRCMRDGQSLDPFVEASKKRTVTSAASHVSKHPRALAPLDQNVELPSAPRSAKDEQAIYTEKDAGMSTAAKKMATLAYSCTAAHCALSILGSSSVPNELRTDDVVLPCLQVMRSTLLNAVMPFVGACAGTSASPSPILSSFVNAVQAVNSHRTDNGKNGIDKAPKTLSYDAEQCRHYLSKCFDTLQHLLAQLSTLAGRGGWYPSDSSVSLLASSMMQLVMLATSSPAQRISLGSIFADESGCESLELAALRIAAIQTLQDVYALSGAEQQSFIVQTILDYVSEIDGNVRAKDGQSSAAKGKNIHPVTALMLQLIQGSTQAVHLKRLALQDAPLPSSQQSTKSETEAATIIDTKALRHLMDEPRNVAGQLADGLVFKLKNAKAGDSCAVESVVMDLLQVILQPTWPGASLLLSYICRMLCAALDDRSSSIEVRGVALDLLGAIAGRLFESTVRLRKLTASEAVGSGNGLGKLEEVLESKDAQSLLVLEKAYTKLVRYLRCTPSMAAQTQGQAVRYLGAQWAVELGSMHRRVTERLEVLQARRGDGAMAEMQRLSSALEALDEALKRLDRSSGTDATLIRDSRTAQDDQVESFQLLYEAVLHSFSYMVPSETIYGKLIEASAGPVATNRGKSIRALSLISEADDSFLLRMDVRSAVQRCLLDESVNVRDGAVALLGRFVLANPNYIDALFPSLKAKIDDAGLMVRKRCLRLLGDIYRSTTSRKVQAEALCEIVRSAHDPEQSMGELALQIIAQVMLGKTAAKTVRRPKVVIDDGLEGDDEQLVALHTEILALVTVVERTIGQRGPLEDIILRLLQKEETGDDIKQHLSKLVEAVVGKIAAAVCGGPDCDAARLAKFLETLVRCVPHTLSITLAKQLLPCVRTCSTPLELQTLGSILDALNSSLPLMGKVAHSFALKLQNALRPLISQPSPHLSILPELVRCYALVVDRHTHDYAVLIKMLQQCHQLLCRVVSRARSRKNPVIANRNDAVVIRLIALLVDSIDFDKVRLTSADLASGIDSITRRSIREEALTLFMRLVDNQSFLPHALYGMRFLFRSSPQLMLQEEVHAQLSQMLSGKDMLQEKSIIIRAVADVLNIEEEIRKKQENRLGYGELVGNLETLADPVSFEIVQTFMEQILDLAVEPSLQACILDIMQHIIMRGMCHPMECLPSLVALETFIEAPAICSKARFLHNHLIAKVGSNISFRYAVCARAAFKLHEAINGTSARGFQPVAHSILQPWYDTVVDCQPRPSRFELLKALCKAFDVQMDVDHDQSDERFARFIAEALSTLEFRTSDEVHFVVAQLDAILEQTGDQVRIFAMEEVEVDGEEEQDEEELEEDEVARVVQVGGLATVMTYALFLRQHLAEQYGLPASSTTNARGNGSPETNARSSNKPAVLRHARCPVSWAGIPSRDQSKGRTPYQHAKAVMGYFDNIMTD